MTLLQNWKETELEKLLNYEQPTKYIIKESILKDKTTNSIPVLTANKSFILGHTIEKEGIFTQLPAILFDDFTTDTKFVDFKFKVKSSAMKILNPKTKDINLKFVFLMMQGINITSSTHKRYYLSQYQQKTIPFPFKADGTPDLKMQQKVLSILEKAEKIKKIRKETNELTENYLQNIFTNIFGDHKSNNKKFKIKGFADVFDITTGKLNSNAAENKGKFPFFTCSKETFYINSYAFNCEALILSGNNAAGDYSVKHYKGKFNAYQRTYILTVKEKENYNFFKKLLELKLQELKTKSIGTNTKYLTLGILRGIKIIQPPIELQNKFAEIVEKIEKLKENQKQTEEEINNLFNVLMQKAFKGELVS